MFKKKINLFSIVITFILFSSMFMISVESKTQTYTQAQEIALDKWESYGIDWDNWQKDSVIKFEAMTYENLPLGNTNDLNVGRYKSNNVFSFTLEELNDTYPFLYLLKNTFVIPGLEEVEPNINNRYVYKNATGEEMDLGYKDKYRTEKAGTDVPVNYSIKDIENSAGASGRGVEIVPEDVYFHPKEKGDKMQVELSFNFTCDKNNLYPNEEKYRVYYSQTFQPKIIKAIHIDNISGEKIQETEIDEKGKKGRFGDKVEISARTDLKSYAYKAYDVYNLSVQPKDKELPERVKSDITEETWKGEVDIKRQAIVFKYNPLHEITFDAGENGYMSSGNNHMKVEHGKAIKELPEPIPSNGYKFEGWYKSDGSQYKFDSPVTEDLTLYAKWGEQKFTVTFDSKGGETKPISVEVKYGEKVEEPESPRRDGYEFLGWYPKGEEEVYDFNTPVETDLILEAKWEIPVVNPLDGKTPIMLKPGEIYNQSSDDEVLRIGYISNFDFDKAPNYMRKSTSAKAKSDKVILKGETKETIVPPFVSIIDGRTDTKDWELTVKASSFYNEDDREKIFKDMNYDIDFEDVDGSTEKYNDFNPVKGATIKLSNLNYAKSLNNLHKPSVVENEIKLSNSAQKISTNSAAEGNSWSLAFGEVITNEENKNKSTGVELQVPAGTMKESRVYLSFLNWELRPSIRGEEYE